MKFFSISIFCACMMFFATSCQAQNVPATKVVEVHVTFTSHPDVRNTTITVYSDSTVEGGVLIQDAWCTVFLPLPQIHPSDGYYLGCQQRGSRQGMRLLAEDQRFDVDFQIGGLDVNVMGIIHIFNP